MKRRRIFSSSRMFTLGGFVLFGGLLLIAIWQAQLTVERQVRARQHLTAPVKTRHAIRPPALPWSGDPAADYAARCEKGMTDQEITWILEDFQNSGLEITDFADYSHFTRKELFAYRAAQQRWYHAALVDGLRLTPEQSAQAATHMAEQFKKFRTHTETIVEGYSEAEKSVEVLMILGLPPYRFLPSLSIVFPFCTEVFFDESEGSPVEFRQFPRDVCTLSPQQEKITWPLDLLADSEVVLPPSDPSLHPDFMNSRPFDQNGQVPGELSVVDSIFPILKSQKRFNVDEDYQFDRDILSYVRPFHPAQFKLILILAPDMPSRIRTAMANATH